MKWEFFDESSREETRLILIARCDQGHAYTVRPVGDFWTATVQRCINGDDEFSGQVETIVEKATLGCCIDFCESYS